MTIPAPGPPLKKALVLGSLATGLFSWMVATFAPTGCLRGSEEIMAFILCTALSLAGFAFTVASFRRWSRSGTAMTTRLLALFLVALLLNLSTGALFLIDYYLVHGLFY